MLRLQTQVKIKPPGFNINYSDIVFLFGSCFSDNIGKQLSRFKLNSFANPFGVLYNPASIADSIALLLEKDRFTEEDLEKYNDLWFSYNHHTLFSDTNKLNCLNKINDSFISAKKKFKDASIIILTFGTAWIYRNKETGNVVANCHKIPAKHFTREYLSYEKITEILSKTFDKIITNNPQVNIITTISPIRHWKDGAVDNNRSKASLVLAIKELEKLFSQLYYFPVYEIFMDELRDYRFYASDMLHPSEFAIEYVWEKFQDTFFEINTREKLNEIQKVVKSFEHKVIAHNNNSYKNFINNLISKAEELMIKYPEISFNEELKKLHTEVRE